MATRRLFLFAACAGLMLTACGRWGFETREAGQIDGADPFVGAIAQGIVVGGEGTAQLDVLGGFAPVRARLPSAFASAGATGVGDSIYVAGGSAIFPGSDTCGRAVMAFDPALEAFEAVGTLAVQNQGLHLEATADGSVYSMMGYCDTSSAEEARVYRYRDSAVGEHVGDMPTPAFYFSSGIISDALGDPILIAAGGFGSGPLRDVVQIMDPGNGTARRLTDTLPSPRCLPAGAALGDTFYVFGGLGNTDCNLLPSEATDPTFTDVIAASLDPDTVEVVAQLPEGLAGACAVTTGNGNILLIGGTRYVADGSDFTREVSDAVWKFTPSDGQFYAQDPLPAPRTGMACGQTDGGRIFLLGGADANMDPVDGIMVYQPHVTSGTLLSALIDSEVPNARWAAVWLDAEVPVGGSASIRVRVTEEEAGWGDDTTGWLDVDPTQPLPETMPRGRYLQWQVTLSTDNPAASPELYGVPLSYSWY